MRSIRRILVPIRNFGARSLPVVDKAAQLAKALGADIELFHDIAAAILPKAAGGPDSTLKMLKADSRRAALNGLERIAAPLRAHGLKVSTSAVWDFPAFEAIVRRATAIGADLIVVPQRARHRLAGLLRYTDWELLRLSPISILLVKTPAPYHRPVVLAAIDPTHVFAKSSALDKKILDQGGVISRALRGSLHAVHAYLPLPLPPTPRAGLQEGFAERVLKATEHKARSALDRTLAKTTIRTAHRHLVQGHPAVVIPAMARKTRSAIVAMGVVSRSGLKRLFIGNTAEEIIDALRCDLLLVKPAHFSWRMPRVRRRVRLRSVLLSFP